jgi:hypothetical protein
MAITTADGIVAGFLAGGPPVFIAKGLVNRTGGRMASCWRGPGVPGLGALPVGGSGTVFSSASGYVDGMIPFRYPSSGKCYLGRALLGGASGGHSAWLVDRIFDYALSATSLAAQSVPAPTWPARDDYGGTDGVGYLVGIEVQTTVGAGTPTINMIYVNSDGVSGRTGSNLHPATGGAAAGSFYPIGLAANDQGVRSVTSIQLTQSWTSGTIAVVVYRVIASFPLCTSGGPSELNPVTGAMIEMFPGTVPFVIDQNLGAVTASLFGFIQYMHG